MIISQSVTDVYKTFKFPKLILISEINFEEFGYIKLMYVYSSSIGDSHFDRQGPAVEVTCRTMWH